MRPVIRRCSRFFSLHYLLPFVIAGCRAAHLGAPRVGQNNPTGVELRATRTRCRSRPYSTTKDSFGLGIFLVVFGGSVFLFPNYLGHADNYIPANPRVHARPYRAGMVYLPFYAILLGLSRTSSWARARAVRLDCDSRLPALARYVTGQIGELSADLPPVSSGIS